MNLRRLTDEEAQVVARRARLSGIKPDDCPTCLSKLLEGERENGTYKFMGEEHPCDCESQVILRKHYLLANIPDQYMRLNWYRDFDGSPEAKEAVNLFLDRWPNFKMQGMGIEFSSKELGVGKTFAATTVGKELVKRGEDVYFVEFRQILHLLVDGDKTVEERMNHAHVLILDEVVAPYTDKQANFFADQFETIVRHRTNYNGVTIITTNMTNAEVERWFARAYSLLGAKQLHVDMTGIDKRRSHIAQRNLELAMNGEVAPIT